MGIHMNNNNDISLDQDQPAPYPCNYPRDQIRSFKRVLPLSIYDFYIIDDITTPDKYIELLQTLKSADQYDTVFIYLNTRGGNLYTTIQILSAMSSTQAKVVTCLEGEVASAGTFIFLKGDTKIVNPNCTLMIHNYSQATSGKGNEIISHVQYQKEYFNKLAHDIYGDFLTHEEITSVMSGEDLWMGSHEVVDRLVATEQDVIYTGDDKVVEINVKTEIHPKVPTPKPKKTPKKKVSKKST